MVQGLELKLVKIEKPEETNMILGQSHFIKTVEDLHEAMANAGGNIKFGIAFCESSGPRLVRFSGNDERLVELARKNAMSLGCGHAFIIFMENGFPINVLNAVKNVPEVCRIYCATANPVEVVVAETGQGRGIMGVIDGFATAGIETEKDIQERKNLLRRFGYKL
ncbi:MAG TPA: hypothetical protein GX506_08595 [Firmicutes bacterium]|nr:hypothetical protein [Bacillota bacterium]